jgi:hypothetical protein
VRLNEQIEQDLVGRMAGKRTKLADTSKQFLGSFIVGDIRKKCQRSHRAQQLLNCTRPADTSINCGGLSGMEFSIDQLCQQTASLSKNPPRNAKTAPSHAPAQ